MAASSRTGSGAAHPLEPHTAATTLTTTATTTITTFAMARSTMVLRLQSDTVSSESDEAVPHEPVQMKQESNSAFDAVFPPSASQKEVYDATLMPLVDPFIHQGYI